MDELSLYDYELPAGLIAREPLDRRDESRLLVLNRKTGEIEHRTIRDLPQFLHPGDCLVLNDTRVIPARLLGTRAKTGGKWEGLFLSCLKTGEWRLIGQTRGRLQPGEQIIIRPAHSEISSTDLVVTLVARDEEGIWSARPDSNRNFLELLQEFGTVPLPPYIHRKLALKADWSRYQTTYAKQPGSVAAPTAGLHFTPELLEECRNAGVEIANVTLHVGIGTFRPIEVETLSEHRMHSEWCELNPNSVQAMRDARQRGNRIVAVGTTTVRTLESAAKLGDLQPWRGLTDLFIRPGFEFRAIDSLLTNFHLPRSTLLVMVSAFAGTDYVKKAYESAILKGYRFFSYGDAMLIL